MRGWWLDLINDGLIRLKLSKKKNSCCEIKWRILCTKRADLPGWNITPSSQKGFWKSWFEWQISYIALLFVRKQKILFNLKLASKMESQYRLSQNRKERSYWFKRSTKCWWNGYSEVILVSYPREVHNTKEY
jgi:hypothetical protein